MQLLILGASARAAAYSALRAGLQPFAVDLFSDVDLRAIAPTRQIAAASYPEDLAAVAATVDPSPWIYTGALENHAELVARISQRRTLWGNDADTLRAVRDPFAVAAVLRRTGLCHPAVRPTSMGLPRDGSWLVKPLASVGGMGIFPLETARGETDDPQCYYQQRIAGPSLAAVFIASTSAAGSSAVLVGVTRQSIGRPGSPFGYAGSLGPWPVTPGVWKRIAALGGLLAAEFRLVGLFGVDLILHRRQPWPVEINPRYTASVEVLELALGRPLLAEHARACDPTAAAGLKGRPVPPRGGTWVVGKLIVFAEDRCRFPGVGIWSPPADPFAVPAVGDLPAEGTRFEAGEPVLTLFAQAPTTDACRSLLDGRRAGWIKRLRATGS